MLEGMWLELAFLVDFDFVSRKAGFRSGKRRRRQSWGLGLGGRLFGGHDALVVAVGCLRLTGSVLVLIGLAPVRWMGRRVYREVARRRACTYG